GLAGQVVKAEQGACPLQDAEGTGPRLGVVAQVHRAAWRANLGEEPGGRRLDVHLHATGAPGRVSQLRCAVGEALSHHRAEGYIMDIAISRRQFVHASVAAAGLATMAPLGSGFAAEDNKWVLTEVTPATVLGPFYPLLNKPTNPGTDLTKGGTGRAQ